MSTSCISLCQINSKFILCVLNSDFPLTGHILKKKQNKTKSSDHLVLIIQALIPRIYPHHAVKICLTF